jgi:2-phosphosulfolactate phosphatase
MQIIIESLIEGAKRAKGLTVIIDVYRAFTTAAYVMNNHAKRILPVGTLEEAFELKKKHPEWILIGEKDGVMVEGMDYGNSPYLIKDVDFTGKTVIMSTIAGTRGVATAVGADEILTGSFVNVDATARYIKRKNPLNVTIVSMGYGGYKKTDEDELFAQFLKEKLEGKTPDFSMIKNKLTDYPAYFYTDKDRKEFPTGDHDCALDVDRFNFVLKVIKNKEGQLEIVKVN